MYELLHVIASAIIVLVVAGFVLNILIRRRLRLTKAAEFEAALRHHLENRHVQNRVSTILRHSTLADQLKSTELWVHAVNVGVHAHLVVERWDLMNKYIWNHPTWKNDYYQIYDHHWVRVMASRELLRDAGIAPTEIEELFFK